MSWIWIVCCYDLIVCCCTLWSTWGHSEETLCTSMFFCLWPKSYKVGQRKWFLISYQNKKKSYWFFSEWNGWPTWAAHWVTEKGSVPDAGPICPGPISVVNLTLELCCVLKWQMTNWIFLILTMKLQINRFYSRLFVLTCCNNDLVWALKLWDNALTEIWHMKC